MRKKWMSAGSADSESKKVNRKPLVTPKKMRALDCKPFKGIAKQGREVVKEPVEVGERYIERE